MKSLLESFNEKNSINQTLKKFYSEFPHLNHFLAKQKNIDVFQRFSITNANSLEHSLFYALKIYEERPLFGYPIKTQEGSIEFKYNWTYGKVLQYCLKLSNSMKEMFNKIDLKGDKIVAICAENSVEWMLCEFSCVLNKYIVVGIHPEWEIESTSQFICETNIKFVFCDSKNLEKMEKIVLFCSQNLNHKIDFLVCFGDQKISFINHKNIFLNELIEKSVLENSVSLSGIKIDTPVIENENKPNLKNLNNIHTLIFSSGSTGKPKLIIKTSGIWKKNHFDECIFVTPYITASFLPLAHGNYIFQIFFFFLIIFNFAGFDRGQIYTTLSNGGRIGFNYLFYFIYFMSFYIVFFILKGL
jgi:long-subunit acyl-CoA synthetase (AMP-forming)